MSSSEMVEEPSVYKLKETGERHCRCYKHGDHQDGKFLLDGVESISLQKSTYYSRVANEYTQKRIVKGGLKIPKKGFRTLRDECIKANKLYQDPQFPPNEYSINFEGVTRRSYVWKRPNDIIQDPRFFVDGATRFDIQQGELGDCWLLAAVCNLTLNPGLFHVVVPRDQGFTQLYAGIFHFKFWQYGKWQEVIVDDMLPTHNGRLVFMHSKTKNEFWCALLEKAYAKLYGGYEALRGGNINESMVDLTGGVVEMIDLRDPPSNMFSILNKANRRGALIGCAIEPDHPGVETEGILPNGLIMRHAYSVTRVTTVDIASAAPKLQGKADLVRLHNPWGNEAEWKGSWSDKSSEWATISPEEKQRLGLTFDDDGEFWMSFKDFSENFTTVEICDVTPEVFDYDDSDDEDDDDENGGQKAADSVQRKWRRLMYEGAWVSHQTAGGCRNFIDTFATNPQYTVDLEDPDEDDDDDLCTIVVSLMQKNVRQLKRYGVDYVPIGFTIYKLPEDQQSGQKLDKEFFKYNASYAKVPFFLNTREVTTRFSFPPGSYVIIPSTFEPETPGEFLLRIFTEAKRR
ncbi:calpain-B-like isoform X2 [Panulirus ornatus]|uniref:calpain-B-like isoform X2 n=1 Tax=Panulirus ornatus TaxID=150431 RepID=UPI003A861C39